MRTLRMGDFGDEVRRLQVALNRAVRPPPRLAEDGDFDDRTRRYVVAFQQDNWLVDDGEAGPATQACLYNLETALPIFHTVPFIPQTTVTNCWAASTAMMTGSTIAAVTAATPAYMIRPDGGLRNASETEVSIEAGVLFGRVHGLHCFPPHSWTVDQMRAQLARGPLMLDMLWNATTYAAVQGSPGHMIVVVGIRGDSDPTGRGTTVRLYDPWSVPLGTGNRHSEGFNLWMRNVPTATYRAFARALTSS